MPILEAFFLFLRVAERKTSGPLGDLDWEKLRKAYSKPISQQKPELQKGQRTLDGYFKPKPSAWLTAARAGNAEALQRQIDSGCDLDEKDKEGNTALHLAVKERRVDIIGILLGTAIDIHARNKAGETALDLAMQTADMNLAGPIFQKSLQMHRVEQPST